VSADLTTAGVPRATRDAWEEEGSRIAVALDDSSAVAVVGDDPEAAARVALGIGRVQSLVRRVAIGDLVGEVRPLQSLVTGDDPHGIVDSFLYGVSLNRIARPADSSGNLFVLPSGSEPLVAEEIFRSQRWHRLASGFRDVGALLLLVVPARRPGIEALLAQLDGVVLAGRSTSVPASASVIAVAEQPPGTRAAAAPPPLDAPVPAPRPVVDRAQPSAPPPAPAAPPAGTASPNDPPTARWIRRIAEAPPTLVGVPVVAGADGAPGSAHANVLAPRAASAQEPEPQWMPPRRPRWHYAAAAGVVLAVVGTVALTRDDDTRSEAGRRTAPTRSVAAAGDSVATGPAVERANAAGTLAEPTPAAPSAGAVTVAPPAVRGPAAVVSNPEDSARAASYSVQIVAANTIEGARAKQRDVTINLPAVTISPMSLGADSTRWYRLTVGAFADRATAINYLLDVRERRKLDLDTENVVRLPFALLLEPRVTRASAKARAAAYAARGIPAYPLLQDDGSVRVYAGAFETPEQAMLLAAQLKKAGVEPAVVAYRTGRGF